MAILKWKLIVLFPNGGLESNRDHGIGKRVSSGFSTASADKLKLKIGC